MKKMTKGALAIGIGSAMLLGGGGTLATWNAQTAANAGNIVTGDLDIAAAPGVWTNANGVIDINKYKVVPGETLTFTQKLDVDLVGQQMKAKLSLSKLPTYSNNISFGTPSLKDAAGKNVDPNKLTSANDGELTASATFTFKDVAGQTDVNTTVTDLSGINYTLIQVTN